MCLALSLMSSTGEVGGLRGGFEGGGAAGAWMSMQSTTVKHEPNTPTQTYAHLHAPHTTPCTRAILDAVTDGVIEELKASLVANIGGNCGSNSGIQATTAIRLRQVLGLWVMLALAMLAGTVVLCCAGVQRRRSVVHQHLTQSLSHARLASRSIMQRFSTISERNSNSGGSRSGEWR